MKNPQSDRRAHLPVDSFAEYMGFDGTTPAVLLNPAFSPNVENVLFDDGIVSSRYGYARLMARWTIAAVTHGSKLFEVVGDLTSYLEVDQSLLAEGSTSNNGTYVVASVTFADPNTEIVVDETVTDSTVDGTLTPLFAGSVVADVEFEDAGGTKYLLAFTTKREYRYDGTNEAWIDISPRWTINTATAGGAGAGELTITGNITSELKAGDTIYVEGSTGNDATYTCASVTWDDPLTDIVPDQAVADGTDDGEIVFERTGSENDMIDVVQATDDSGTYVISTNNINSPLYWNGSGDFTILIDDVNGGALSLLNFVTCKTLGELHGYLWMGNVQTTSTDKRVAAYSDTGDFFDFETGNSGSNLFTDGEGQLLRFVRHGDFLVAYFDRSVHLIAHVGAEALWSIDKHVSGVGPVSPRAIANLGPFHVFMGEQNFYMYDGTSLVRTLGERTIGKRLREDFSSEFAARAHAFVDPKLQHVYFTVPTGETTKKTYLLNYNLTNIQQSKWTILDFNDPPMSFGWFSRTSDLTWASLQTLKGDAYTWDVAAGDVSYVWNSAAGTAGTPTKVLGSGSYVYIYEQTMTDDAGVAIDSWKDSSAMTVPNEFESVNGRWYEVEVDLKGSSCDVLYSVDEGLTWSYLAQEADGSDANGITLTSEWTTYKFFVDVIAKTFSVRLRNPDLSGSFKSRWLRVWVRPGEPS